MNEIDAVAKKRKKNLIVVGSLALVFCIILANSLYTIKKKSAPPPPTKPPAAAGQSLSDRLVFVTDMRLNDKLREEQEKVWDKEWDRDPFVPQAASAIVRAINLKLDGILWDEAKPKAIVNEKTLLVGDTIYGYTVVDIKPRSVILRTGEKNIELYVFRPLVVEN